jgi:hypothetical protein
MLPAEVEQVVQVVLEEALLVVLVQAAVVKTDYPEK